MKLKDFDFRIWDSNTNEFIEFAISDNIRAVPRKSDDLVLELWTGFYDRKGKKICEGDILAHDNGYGIEYHTKVVFENGVFKIAIIEHPAVEIIEGLDTGFVEVVGNIHENTELLNH